MLEQEVISISADQQKAVILLARFKGEDRIAYQQSIFENHDDVAFTSYNETFKVTPFVGITQYSSTELNFESIYNAGLRIEARINERLITGFGLTHSSMATKEATSEFDYSSYGVDLYSKFYLFSESRFQPYVGAGVGYLKSVLQLNDNGSDTSTLNGEMMGGVDLMFTRAIGFNFEAKYVKPVSSSVNTQTYSQTYAQYTVDKLAHEIENSGHLILTLGMIVSF